MLKPVFAFLVLSSLFVVTEASHASHSRRRADPYPDPVCPPPEVRGPFSDLDMAVAAGASVVFLLGLGFTLRSTSKEIQWTDQLKIERDRVARLESDKKLSSAQISYLETQLAEQKEAAVASLKDLSQAQADLTRIQTHLKLLNEMDPELDAKKEAWVLSQATKAAELAKAQAESEQKRQLLTEGGQKIQNLLADMKRDRR